MNQWHKLHITDKTGKEFFKVDASPMSTMPEIKNLTKHLDAAKSHPSHYKFLDVESAVIMLDGSVYSLNKTVNYDELLSELGLND